MTKQQLGKYEIRLARSDEATELTQLALRSKAFWGYSDHFMAACVEEMTVLPEMVESKVREHWLAVDQTTIVGFYVLDWQGIRGCELDALYVDPDRIGEGLGKRLLLHAKNRATLRKAPQISIQSDPNAEAFYLAMGAKRVGLRESGSIPDRQLPLLEMTLGTNHG